MCEQQQGADNSGGGGQSCSSVGKGFIVQLGGVLSGYFFFLLSGLEGVLKRLSLAISVKQFFSSVIQVLQSQHIQRAGKCSPGQRGLVRSWNNLQPIPQPNWYTAAKGAHGYGQVMHLQKSNTVLNPHFMKCMSVSGLSLIFPVTT